MKVFSKCVDVKFTEKLRFYNEYGGGKCADMQ